MTRCSAVRVFNMMARMEKHAFRKPKLARVIGMIA